MFEILRTCKASQSAMTNATHTAIFAHYRFTLFRQSEPLYTLVEYWSILRHDLKRFLVRLYPPVLQCEQPLYEHCERKSIKHNQIAKASPDINSNGLTAKILVPSELSNYTFDFLHAILLFLVTHDQATQSGSRANPDRIHLPRWIGQSRLGSNRIRIDLVEKRRVNAIRSRFDHSVNAP